MELRVITIIGIYLLCLFAIPTMALAQEPDRKDTQELLDRIETLEKQIKRLDEEAKARKSLEITEEEKVQQEKEVLSAVSREYSLDPKGSLALDYSLGYSYSPSEVIYTSEEQLTMLEREADHSIQHTIYTSYSILDNLSTSLTLPVLYKYNKVGTDNELDETDIGDITLGVAYQPLKGSAGDIRSTLSLSASFPTGRSPFTINPKTELSTGSGYYELSVGGNFSKQIDPVVLFWNAGYSYPFDVRNLDYVIAEQVTLEKVQPGSSFNASLGMGYALSYASSINMSFSYSYQLSTELKYKELSKVYKTGDKVSASFGLGMGLNITAKTAISISLSYSLTSTGFSISTRVPFSFMI